MSAARNLLSIAAASDLVALSCGAKRLLSLPCIIPFNVQRGVVVIPKSTHKERTEQNFDIWDFTLSEEDMETIANLDTGQSGIVNHYDPKFVKRLHGLKLHK